MSDAGVEARARLTREVGSGRQFAERIRLERQRRGWSQAELARRLREVGPQLDQAAISKIETVHESDRARRIDIDEAIGFARVFDLSVEQMTLPTQKAHELEVLRVLTHAASYARSLAAVQISYERAVRIVGLAIEVFPEVMARFDERKRVTTHISAGPSSPEDSAAANLEGTFLDDVDDWRRGPVGLRTYPKTANLEEELALELEQVSWGVPNSGFRDAF